MLVQAYGLFWDRQEVDWNPGGGKRCRLLGHFGENRPTLRVADHWEQGGLYVLYSYLGPYYVGLVRGARLGLRLKEHTRDRHRDYWVRFSWFGFRKVLKRQDDLGLCDLARLSTTTIGSPVGVIRDMEALLIKAMATYNIRNMNFSRADEWEQVRRDERDYYLERVRPR
jgi:hypothetical protein